MNTQCHIGLDLEGATESDLARGVAAAITVFEEASVDPWDAAVASHDLEWETSNSPNVSEDDINLSNVYSAAIEAALKAACEDLPNHSKKYNFSLRWDGDEPRQPHPDALEVVFPTTEFGRPPEEIITRLAEKRRKLVGWNWEWEYVN